MPIDALVQAARSGDLVAMKTALQQGADINGESKSGQRPLYGAAEAGHAEAVLLLIEAGADVNAKSYGHLTALHGAARNGELATGRLLVEHGAPETERILNDVLHVAQMTVRRNPALVDLLQDHRVQMARPEVSGTDTTIDLFTPAMAGDARGVAAALDNGADVNGRDGRGLEALSWAALRGHTDVVNLLIEHGADVNRENASGWPPLAQACW